MSTTLYTFSKASVVNRYHSNFGVTLSGVNVTAWDDQVGTAHMTVTAGEEPAFRDTYPAHCRIRAEYLEANINTSNPRGLTIPSRTYDKRNFTALFVIDSYSSHAHFQTANDDTSGVIWKSDATSFVRATGSGVKRNFDWNTTPGAYNFTVCHSPVSRCVVVVTWGASGRALYLNGRSIATGAAATAGTFASAGRVFRDGATTQFFGGVDEIVFWDTDSTAAVAAAISREAMDAWGITDSRLCAYCTDSIWYGFNTPDRATARVFRGGPGRSSGVKGNTEVQYMFGKPGYKASEAVTNYANQAGDTTDTYLRGAWYQHRRAYISLGNNDIRLDSATAATVFGNLQTLAVNLRASGFNEVEIETIAPWSSITAAHELTRSTVNRWLKANPRGLYSKVIDTAADPFLRNPAVTAAYFDGIHRTTAGNRRAVEYGRETRSRHGRLRSAARSVS